VREAEGYLEATDVLNDEYQRAFDGEGRLLRLTVRSKTALERLRTFSGDDVIVEAAEEQPSHAEDLKALLISSLRALAPDRSALETQSLRELLDLAVARFGNL
jgi:hypothetical protein